MFSQLWKEPEKVMQAKRLDITGALWFLLWKLLSPMFAENKGRFFVCEYCRKIGTAERSDKRYCSNVPPATLGGASCAPYRLFLWQTEDE